MKKVTLICSLVLLNLASSFAEDTQALFIDIGKKYNLTFSNSKSPSDSTSVVIRKYVGNGFYQVSYIGKEDTWWLNLNQVVTISPF